MVGSKIIPMAMEEDIKDIHEKALANDEKINISRS